MYEDSLILAQSTALARDNTSSCHQSSTICKNISNGRVCDQSIDRFAEGFEEDESPDDEDSAEYRYC